MKTMKRTLYWLGAMAIVFAFNLPSVAQVSITPGSTVTQNFDGIGTSATAALPSGWKADKQSAAQTVGNYGAAATVTERQGGNNMEPTAANGIYNYGAGNASSALDRAVGGVSSSQASKSVNVYVQLTNNGTAAINTLTISFDVEKYRKGTNTSGPPYVGNPFRIQMYHSTDGSAWTDAGANFKGEFAADDATEGYGSAPGDVVNIVGQELTLPTPLAAGASIYLAWNYSVSTGTYTSYSQGLGVDNISITADGTVNLATTEADKGTPVSVVYYTLTGAQIDEPADGQTYIQTTTYDSGIVETVKLIKK